MDAALRDKARAPVGDPAFRELKRLIVARTGHAYFDDKDDALWERVRRRLSATGAASCADYLARMEGQGGDGPEWRALEASVAIGETFFFRYAEQFAALRGTILPDLLRANDGKRRLRIWSAGCSNGAEAYSLAIVASEALRDADGPWNVSILATDISEHALASARAGRFNRWALRTLSEAELGRYFTRDRSGPSPMWTIRPAYRAWVRFERFNLMALVERRAPLQFSEFDLILCRNVLIYFSLETAVRAVEGLRDALATNGWLVLGHAEANAGIADLMAPVELAGAIVYRRREAVAPVRLAPPVSAFMSPPNTSPPPASAHAYQTPVRVEARPPDRIDSDVDADMIVAGLRALASGADARALIEASEAAARAFPLDARPRFYAGVGARALGLHEEAAHALRRALYLDRGFALARLHLALLLLERGSIGQALRALQAVARAARARPADEPVPEGPSTGEAMTMSQLAALARRLIDEHSTREAGRSA
jgi:chemotaxis protein methyltransferase CheR